MKRVAIIGGGYAGMAAGVELAAAGVSVTVFEAGKVLGGRARRVDRSNRAVMNESPLDNGQHLVIGAYSELLRLMQCCGVDLDAAFLRQPMRLQVEPDFLLACPKLPAPLHLALGLIRAKGLSWVERWALIRAIEVSKWRCWRLKNDVTVAQWLLEQRQPESLIAKFWAPLTLAALNTPLELASAQVLLNVLRDSLGGQRAASDLLMPKVDFSQLFPESAAQMIQTSGGYVQLGYRVKSIASNTHGFVLGDDGQVFDAVICATPPHQAAGLISSFDQLLSAQLTDWQYQPIVTVYLQYATDVQLSTPMLGLADAYSQWVFDRGVTHGQHGLIAVVISAQGVHSGLSHDELAETVQAELHQRLGLPDLVLRQQVITEKRATFACTPNLERPSNTTLQVGLFLAGDFTEGLAGHGRGEYPATLEGAVRSGVNAAQLTLEYLGYLKTLS
ncbi:MULTISPECIES: hydroxysqualene dehydroxylase HpnE [Deefgea]|uniref:NAD(P)-binding protein n=1 Tax=Deefgea chitinilytica TaxID=570276 RepID=A0ABS2C9I8_9NEIS|nr:MULTISPECIES: hydroxysqualene dehydroxylase HpnE [Deefgea]MBM5570811.1 NAD(P)-binding protein [Deefgea chitinilytica]MBM9888040.1 FAD-dependent oxidoreductase [Deefgea sp. CFH1-16]